MKKVLVVEKEPMLLEYYERAMAKDKVALVFARSAEDARERFLDHRQEIEAITVCGCLDDNQLDTERLVRNLRANFKGPIIGTSVFYSVELTRAGCTHECSKNDLPRIIREVLGLAQKPVLDSESFSH